MDMSSPTKPPRGVKASRETSGLLMSVIRTLSTSESNEQRDREKAKLEREYKRCDEILNELVSLYKGDLEKVMQLFAQMSTTMTNTREKLRAVKEILIACKSLLSCRRDELKKLWFEGVEHKYLLQLLDEIEQLNNVPSKLAQHLSNKDYISATKILVSALNAGEGDLEGVEALREVRSDLQASKDKLFDLLVKEISNIIYAAPVNNINSLSSEESFFREKKKWRQKILDANTLSSYMGDVSQDADYETELRMLVECLGLLNKLHEAVETIKSHMQTEILNVVEIVSKNVLLKNSAQHPLLKLLEVLIEQLKKVAQRFRSLLTAFSEISTSSQLAIPSIQMSDVWGSIQAVMQLLLTDYLDIQNTNNEPVSSPGFPDQNADISSFFVRRRIQRPRKFPLFKFEYSSNISFLSKEHQSPISLTESKQRGKLLICPPDPFNITVVYKTLLKFVGEIESSLSLQSGVPCTLKIFINDYVKDIFIGREHSKILLKIESATKSSNAWRTPISPNDVLNLGLVKPVLQSTFQVNEAIKELEMLLDSLPKHRHEVLDIMVNLLKNFVETCNAAYRGIIQPEPEDKRLYSAAAWLKDEDISRFLKSLPNWVDLQAQKSLYLSGKTLKREDTTEEESPEDVKQRNIKEAEILASNLGEGGIGAQEIISDPLQLKCLAQLQESMEWFAIRMLQITASIKKKIQDCQENNNLNKYATMLSSLSEEFEELANTCLLVLHLEIRVQCFYYLLPTMGKSRDNSHDPDPRVLDLSRVLVAVDEALSPSLQQRKCKYIFEGLGHLIAKILMSYTQYLEKIDESAIHKMCRNIFTLQQTLSNITVTREVALDHARRYFQLFFMTPEDILNQVLEKGPEFSELEYINALQLINRTYNNSADQSSNQKYLQRLSDILGEVGVTV